ncbi:hypothetical protein MBAV_002128 [Candidatus Magnetobacterium bavaricum]|uniref:Uncharacterized protein n=1 Tax=Candidatus Magnetobacterium bavaricum TaxID=29290 RepID=A0A0F3GUW7_9BACT|nr:hypothetical protein MBAV_002128 [Candidatus Magnetobacterium bavaricum]
MGLTKTFENAIIEFMSKTSDEIAKIAWSSAKGIAKGTWIVTNQIFHNSMP